VRLDIQSCSVSCCHNSACQAPCKATGGAAAIRCCTLTVNLWAVSFHRMSVVVSSTSSPGSPKQRFSTLLEKKGLALNDISSVAGPPLEG